MKFNKSLIAAVAFITFAGAVQAAPETFTLAKGVSLVSDGQVIQDLSGSVAWSFSKTLITALSFNSAKVQAPPDVALQVSTLTTSFDTIRYVSVDAAAPVVALTSSFDGSAFTVQSVQSSGGVQLTTVKTGTTIGPGSLSVSDLKVDLITKTIYADVVGANGLGNLNDYALWTYKTISGATTVPLDGTDGARNALLAATFSGLFLVNPNDVGDIFAKALNLNNTGRSGFTAVDRRDVTNTAGFGTITLNATIAAVPEPGSWVLLSAGLVGLTMTARRRAVH